ncbi:MAG: hypothetical protein LBM60_08670 [Clostridium sp.]|jgi:YbbR domain-containing protein|nr:hypothetical protein [Clostridium sp.]
MGQKEEKQMRKKLFSNWGIKLISLILAATLWFVVMYLENPPDTAVFDNITVELLNMELLTDENKVYEVLDGSDVVRRVTVSAPTNVLSGIKASDIIATADLENLTATDTIAIDFSIPAYNISAQDLEGSTRVVKLSIEDRKQKTLSVRAVQIGEVAGGYELDSIKAENNRITIAGAASRVDRADYAEAIINVGNATSNISMESQIQIYDHDGNLMDITTLEIGSSMTKVDAVVYATKKVPIVYAKIGTPAEGYMENGEEECLPNEVLIAGPERELSQITQITIPSEQVNISDYTRDFVLREHIESYLPVGQMRLAEYDFNGMLEIRIGIDPIEEKTINILASNIRFNSNLTQWIPQLTVPEVSYAVVVSGLAKDLEGIVEQQVNGTINIEQWMRQEKIETLSQDVIYEIPVSFFFDSKVTIEEPLRVLVQFQPFI